MGEFLYFPRTVNEKKWKGVQTKMMMSNNGVKGANGSNPNPNNTRTSSAAQDEKPTPLINSGGLSLGR